MTGGQVTNSLLRARGVTPRAIQCLSGVASVSLLGVVLLGGCQRSSSDSMPVVASPGNHPPVIRTVTIRPAPLTLTSPVIAHVEAQDVDRNSLRFRYQWTINGGAVAGQEGEQLPAALLKRGDQVSVQAWPHDGIVEGASMTSEQVVVANSPPVIGAVEIDPQSVFPGMRVQVRAKMSDLDGDTIQVLYRWWKNGKLNHEGDETEFETAGFIRGDTLVVEAVPSDGASTGAAIRSAAITVGNTPPKIVSNPATTVVNNRYDYRVEATDAESDAITFSLETAPSGMQIDAQTGVVTWAAESSQVGAHKVRILAKDSQGAVAFQEFELNLTAVVPAAPAGA